MLNKTCTYVLYGTSTTPSNTPKMCNPQEFFIVLYMTGDCAIGDGVKKYFFSLCLNKVQTGLHLHLGKSMLSYTFLNICGYTDVLIAQFLVYLLRLHWWENNSVQWSGRPLGPIHLLAIAPGGSVPRGRENNQTFFLKSGSTFEWDGPVPFPSAGQQGHGGHRCCSLAVGRLSRFGHCGDFQPCKCNNSICAASFHLPMCHLIVDQCCIQ